MSPQPTIGHYRVIGKLGEDGVGAVCRATDTKLNRDVGIRVFPNSFAQDPHPTRFTLEAQVLASLNQPNIACIYGVEEDAIVMELVEGSELKGLPSLEIALGIYFTHRGLKPLVQVTLKA